MTTNAEYAEIDQTDPTGENDSPVIDDFRRREKALKAQLKEAQAQAEQALVEARAQVERENTASQLMSNAGFGGLADVFASDVDGDLTVDAAAKWLAERGLTASPEGAQEAQEPVSEQVGDVADLASQVAAADQSGTPQDFSKRIDQIEANTHNIGAFNEQLAALFE